MDKMDRNRNEEVNVGEKEEKHSSYTHTEVKVPVHLPQQVFVSSAQGLAQELLGEGFHASIARVSGGSHENELYESPEMCAEAQKDYEMKVAEQENLAKEFEKELERRTEAYRKQTEIETEKIRKELEKQHLRDVEFRKELVEAAIANQSKQVDLEARYAKKELDRQRKIARESLERIKFSQDIQVNLDTAAGNTVSGATTVLQSEKHVKGA